MKNYIQNQKSKQKNYSINGIQIYIKDPLPDNIDPNMVLQDVFSLMPRLFFRDIKYIKIGDFEELSSRDLDALYKNSTIFLTNLQDSNDDMLDDIIHEVAHSVEEVYSSLIYSDGLLEKEFFLKRMSLKKILSNMGNSKYLDKFSNLSYDREFDFFLYKEIGYEKIESAAPGLFLEPYAATSVREYFANGFENFFLNQNAYQILRKSHPVLFKKLIKLLSLESEEIRADV